MTGITSYGAYIPRLRLNRMKIFQAMGWFAPAIISVAQGEKAVCNWDEDALTMAVEAGRDCLKGKDRDKVDALFLGSTTLPYADRQNAGIASVALNLGENVLTADFTSSLKAGTGALAAALDAVEGGKENALVIASDHRQTKAAYFYEMWFGDGAGSLLVGSDDVIAEYKGGYSVSYDFPDHYRGSMKKFDYMWEERWTRDEGYAKILPEAIRGALDKCDLSTDDLSKVVYPCFFKREHAGIAKKLGLPPEKVQGNMHEVCGEAGAAHPFLMFIAALEEAQPGDKILVASFGQGSDALIFEVTENIKKLSPRRGVKGALAERRDLDSYEKYLKFRDLIQTEMGIRAEVAGQTAMSTLWRKRHMVLGLVGGRCTKCETRQFPKSEICVNPDCRAFHSQEDWRFADTPAYVKTFTGDMLAVSIDPPAIYGIVQFEGGGRLLADFTDCGLDEVKVGQKMEMSFRKRFYDEERGYHGYFWKAAPASKEDGGEQ